MSNVFKKTVSSVLLTGMCMMVPLSAYGQVTEQTIPETYMDTIFSADDAKENDFVLQGKQMDENTLDLHAPSGFAVDEDANDEDKMQAMDFGVKLPKDDSQAQDAAHKAGEHAYWAYDSDTKTITISGTGDMYSYSEMPKEFYSDSALSFAEHLVVEEGITSIGTRVFVAFWDLQTVELPDSLKEIGYAAFARCEELTEVNIPSGVEYIGSYAFQETRIEEFTIPASLEYFYPEILYRSACKNVYVEEGNQGYCSADGIIFTPDMKTLVCFPSGKTGDYKIPDSVDTLGESSFIRCSIDRVNLNKVKKLEDYVFAYSCLDSITIPDCLTSIGECEWEGSSQLKTVTFGNGLKKLGYRTFSECSALTTINWGKNLTDLDMLSFAECTSLKSVSVPAGVEYIKNGTFGDCFALERVTLPSSVKGIWYQAFLNDSKLKSITLPKGLKEINRLAFWNTGISEITLPDGVTFVGAEAFSPGVKINKPDRLTKLDDGTYKVIAKVKLSVIQSYTDAYKVLKQVNAARAAAGLSKVSMDKDLLAAAMKRAAECSLFFSHTRPNDLECFSACKKMTRENIAAGQTSPDAAMSSWMKSSGHKANILGSDVKSIGIGCVKVDGVTYWVQCFGTNTADKADSSDYIDQKVTKTIYLDPKAEDTYEGEKMSFQADLSQKQIKIGKTAKITLKVHNGYCYTTIPSRNLMHKTSVSGVVTASEGTLTGKSAGSTTVTTYLTGYPEFTFKNKVQVACSATSITGIKRTTSGIKLSWKKVTGAVKYQVYRKTSNGYYTKVKTTTNLSWLDKNVKKGKSYSYKIKTVDSKGTGAYSKVKTIK